MATADYIISNQSGASFRTDLNNTLAAIVSNNSNSSEPATKYAYQWWADTSANVMKIRNSANDGWIELFQLDGTLTLEDGSASTPALAFRDDLDTGIYSSAANKFNVATAGVERMELGATTIFNEDGADVDFRIEGNSNANLFYLDAGNERIGIGSSSPNTTLHIFAPPLNTATLTTTNCLQLGLWVKPDGSGSNTTGHIYTGIAVGDGFAGMYGIDAGASAATALGFFTGNNSATSERMRITGAGNVGIGRTDPPNKLRVEDSVSGVIVAKQTTNNGGFNTFEGKSSDGSTTFYASHNGRVGASDGIIFGSDTDALNVLDDYEEGTYTPTLTFASDDGNKAYATRGGAYTKIGRQVTVKININLSNRGTGSGLAKVSLPFTVGDRLANTSFEGGGYAYLFLNLLSSVSTIHLQARENTTNAELRGVLGTASGNMADFGYNFCSNTTELRMTVTYFT